MDDNKIALILACVITVMATFVALVIKYSLILVALYTVYRIGVYLFG